MVQIDLFATGVALTIGSSKIGVEALRWGDRGVRQRDDTGIAGRYGVGDLDAIADGSPVKENAVDVLGRIRRLWYPFLTAHSPAALHSKSTSSQATHP